MICINVNASFNPFDNDQIITSNHLIKDINAYTNVLTSELSN